MAWLASAPVKTTVQNIRAFEDGDKVFLQTVYNFAGAGKQVAFDIFRFDAPAAALIGVGVADSDVIYWYDAENAAAIVGHADPLTLDAETGNFVTTEGTAVASPIK